MPAISAISWADLSALDLLEAGPVSSKSDRRLSSRWRFVPRCSNLSLTRSALSNPLPYDSQPWSAARKGRLPIVAEALHRPGAACSSRALLLDRLYLGPGATGCPHSQQAATSAVRAMISAAGIGVAPLVRRGRGEARQPEQREPELEPMRSSIGWHTRYPGVSSLREESRRCAAQCGQRTNWLAWRLPAVNSIPRSAIV